MMILSAILLGNGRNVDALIAESRLIGMYHRAGWSVRIGKQVLIEEVPLIPA